MAADHPRSFDFARRRRALLAKAEAAGAGAVLVFGFGDALGAGSQSHAGLRYLTGWNGHEAQSLLILTARDAHLLVGSSFLFPEYGGHCPELRFAQVPPSRWGEAAVARTGGSAKLATAGFGEIPAATLEHIAQRLPGVGFTPLDDQLSDMRMVKDATELAALCEGAALCDALFFALPALLRSGEPVWKIQLRLEMQARMHGAGYCRTWLTVSPAADRPRYWPEENRTTPSEGDQALFGVALTVDGYWAHGIRMGSLGPARPDHRALWSVADAALTKGQARLVPGTPLAQAEAAMSDHVLTAAAESGWPDPSRFRGGHGLGLSYEEPRVSDQFVQHWGPAEFQLAPTAPIAAQEAMVLELHPNLFVPNLGGAALGEMMLVGPKGAQPLLQFPRRMFEA